MSLISEERIAELARMAKLDMDTDEFSGFPQTYCDAESAIRQAVRETAEACAEICKWAQHSPGCQLAEEIRRRMVEG